MNLAHQLARQPTPELDGVQHAPPVHPIAAAGRCNGFMDSISKSYQYVDSRTTSDSYNNSSNSASNISGSGNAYTVYSFGGDSAKSLIDQFSVPLGESANMVSTGDSKWKKYLPIALLVVVIGVAWLWLRFRRKG